MFKDSKGDMKVRLTATRPAENKLFSYEKSGGFSYEGLQGGDFAPHLDKPSGPPQGNSNGQTGGRKEE